MRIHPLHNAELTRWCDCAAGDLAIWEDWPGIDADSEWDALAVWSGNCILDDDGHPVCIYSGGRTNPCDTGVCAYSKDWVRWEKVGCMTRAPSAQSQTNHDNSIFRLGKMWYVLVGGCTFAGGGT